MANQFFTYPPVNATTSSPSTGPWDSVAPLDATLVGGKDGTNQLRALLTDSTGQLQIVTTSTALPTNAATASNQTAVMGAFAGGTVANNSVLSGGLYLTSLPILSNFQQSGLMLDSSARLLISPLTTASTININNISGTVSLPTGAATSANQSTQITSLQSIDTKTIANVVSTVNSSTTPLAGNATFTGTAEDVSKFGCIQVYLAADQSGTLNIDYSSDGTNFDQTESYTFTVVTPGSVTGTSFQFMTEGRYYRLRYVNGASAQLTFRLQTILKVQVGAAEVEAVSIPMIAATDALTTKSVIYGVTTAGGGSYVGVKVNPSGTLTVDASGTTVPVSQSGTWNITNISGTVSLPTGASTSALQTTGNSTLSTISGQLPTTLGQKASAASLAVVLASDQSSIPVAATQSGNWSVRNQDGSGTAITSHTRVSSVGLDAFTIGFTQANAPVFNDYTSTSITTAAYTQLIASTTSATHEIEIFDSSGQALYLATGGAGSEVNQIVIFPGGNSRIKLSIPAGTRISAKAITATASTGFLAINLYA